MRQTNIWYSFYKKKKSAFPPIGRWCKLEKVYIWIPWMCFGVISLGCCHGQAWFMVPRGSRTEISMDAVGKREHASRTSWAVDSCSHCRSCGPFILGCQLECDPEPHRVPASRAWASLQTQLIPKLHTVSPLCPRTSLLVRWVERWTG